MHKAGYSTADIGLTGTFGDVIRLSNRIRVVKAFRGIHLEGIGLRTAKGYDALLRTFLIHLALEQYAEITGQKIWQFESAHETCGSVLVIARIFETDKDSRLFNFVSERLNTQLRIQFARCRDRQCSNVGIVSSALRHIFAHGPLTPNANDVKPERLVRICNEVSDFLIEFMDQTSLIECGDSGLAKRFEVGLK